MSRLPCLPADADLGNSPDSPSGAAPRLSPSGASPRLSPSGAAPRLSPSGAAPRLSPSGGTSDWFERGVRFRCLGPECGACCSGQQGPGAVWVSGEEIERLAEHRSLAVDEFRRRYVRRLEGRDSLREHANYDCIFYRQGTGCTVYETRPTQCRTYPFWGRVTATRRTWEMEAEKCPGIGCDDHRVQAEEIRRQLEIDQRRHPKQSDYL